MKREYNDEDLLNMRLIRAIYNGVKYMRKREAEKIKQAGVTFAQFEVLVVVYHFAPLTINQIIDKTLSSIGNISLVISNLVKDDYLTSTSDEKDKRIKLINLTDKTEKFMQEFFPTHLQNLDDILSALQKNEKEELLRLMRKIRFGS